MRNEYARARGVDLSDNTDPEALACEPRQRPLRQLSEKEKEIIARRRALIHQHMPEMVPEIQALLGEGLISGWRNIRRVEVFSTGEVV